MRRMRVIFAGALVLLLLIFSFNAYACLLPLFGVPQAAMGGSCADPQDQPVRQFCDTFTTLGLHAASDFHLSVDVQVVSPTEAAPLTSLISFSLRTPSIQGYPAQRPPQDALIRTTVLRI
jgi:hypothetical protein